jgi:hypothetical protein
MFRVLEVHKLTRHQIAQAARSKRIWILVEFMQNKMKKKSRKRMKRMKRNKS